MACFLNDEVQPSTHPVLQRGEPKSDEAVASVKKDEQDKKIDKKAEALSLSALASLCLSAGWIAKSGDTFDDVEGLDVRLSRCNKFGAFDTKPLFAQVKSWRTSKPSLTGNSFQYSLRVKDYNRLCQPNPFYPCVLVLVRIPTEPCDWISEIQHDGFKLHYCAYWAILKGQAPDSGKNPEEKISVKIDKANLVTAKGLNTMYYQYFKK